MGKQHIVNFLNKLDRMIFRNRPAKFQKLSLYRCGCHGTVSALKAVPEVAEVMISVTPSGIRKSCSKSYRFVVCFFIKCNVIFSVPVIRNIHQTYCTICHPCIHNSCCLPKHLRFQMYIRNYQNFHLSLALFLICNIFQLANCFFYNRFISVSSPSAL